MVIRRSALHSAFILIASFFNPLWKPCRTPGRPAISNSNQNTNRNIRHCYFVLRTLNINLLFPDWQRALGGRLLQQQHNMDKHMLKGLAGGSTNTEEESSRTHQPRSASGTQAMVGILLWIQNRRRTWTNCSSSLEQWSLLWQQQRGATISNHQVQVRGQISIQLLCIYYIIIILYTHVCLYSLMLI